VPTTLFAPARSAPATPMRLESSAGMSPNSSVERTHAPVLSTTTRQSIAAGRLYTMPVDRG